MIEFIVSLFSFFKRREGEFIFDGIANQLRQSISFPQRPCDFIRDICFYVLAFKTVIYIVAFFETPLIEKIAKNHGVGITKTPIIQAALNQFIQCDNGFYLSIASN